jgi:hypothetical protein
MERLIRTEEVVEAMEFPPQGSPATVRGQLIRQFARTPPGVRASWSSIIFPSQSGMQVLRLDR